jgi:hypothetical protein
VDQNLSFIEWAEISRLRIAEPDDADQLIVEGIGDRNGVGELLGGIDPVAMADRNIRIGGRAGRLAGPSRGLSGETNTGEKTQRQKTALH